MEEGMKIEKVESKGREKRDGIEERKKRKRGGEERGEGGEERREWKKGQRNNT